MREEVIISEGIKVLDKLKDFPEFYLAGGTGLALQLGHRISLDFDLFWRGDIPEKLLSRIRNVFRGERIKVIVNHREQLTVSIGAVYTSFVKYSYPVVLDFIEYKGINILPAIEIGAMKAYALGRRATMRDYVDLYFVLKTYSLVEVIKICKRKYGNEFNKRLFLEQLIYLEDIEDVEIRFSKEKVERGELTRFFEGEIRKMELE